MTKVIIDFDKELSEKDKYNIKLFLDKYGWKRIEFDNGEEQNDNIRI